MSAYWVKLAPADLSQVFDAHELAALSDAAHAAVADMLGDMAAYVREAVAQNRGNRLPADPISIPRSLRAAALDILAVRLLKRFALTVTDARAELARAGEEAIERVRGGKLTVLDEAGNMPAPPSGRPAIIAPRPAYGNDGVGFYPVPD